MGSTISICNLTAVIINVALKHATPLYYHNDLHPNECAVFEVGKVWFTVEAKVWMNGTNDYNRDQVALPIVGASLIAPAAALGVLGVAVSDVKPKSDQPIMSDNSMSSSVERTSSVGVVAATGALLVPGVATGVAGAAINTDNSTPGDWRTQKTGVYMNKSKRINITGGPDPEISFSVEFGRLNGKPYQYIDPGYEFKSLDIALP